MIIHRNVRASITLDRIVRHVGSTKVVAVEENWCKKGDAKVIAKLTNLDGLNNCVTNCTVLNLNRRLGNGRLLLGAPDNEIWAKEHSIPDS